MRRALTSITVAAAIIGAVTGCGGSSSDAIAEKAAEHVAVAYARAMWRIDFHEACALEFTNRRGPAYRGETEADKKRECEIGWRHNHPLQPGARGPAELSQVRHLFGLRQAIPRSAEVSADQAVVTLSDPTSGTPREFRMRQEGGRWLVYEENVEEEIGP